MGILLHGLLLCCGSLMLHGLEEDEGLLLGLLSLELGDLLLLKLAKEDLVLLLKIGLLS